MAATERLVNEEIEEREFIARLEKCGVSASRRQLRNLRDTGQIRGAVQRHAAGLRGSRSMYLASEVDRAAALLTVTVPGRRTTGSASRAAWLAQGALALPAGQTSRSYIVKTIEHSQTNLTNDALGSQLMHLVRIPADLDAPEVEHAEVAYNFVEEALGRMRSSVPVPMLDLLMHCLVVKDYIELPDSAELHPVAEVFGRLYNEYQDYSLFSDSFFRQPLSQVITDPEIALDSVDDSTIDRARVLIGQLVDSFSTAGRLTNELLELKVPVPEDFRKLMELGQLLTPNALAAAPMIVAFFALRLQQDAILEERAQAIMAAFKNIIPILEQVKTVVEADPTVLKKLKQNLSSI